jgi:hypothetical protein
MASAIQQAESTRQSRSRQLERGRGTPYKLVIAGVDAADIVCGAGGLVCDAVHAGLRVEVYLESIGGEHALQILGVAAEILPARFDFGAEWPDAVFFSGSLDDRNQALGRLIADTSRRRSVEIASWDPTGSAQSDGTASIEHRLSYAARAFKHHAVKAVGSVELATGTELFSAVGRRGDGAVATPWR